MKIKIGEQTEKEINEQLKKAQGIIEDASIDRNFIINMQIAAGVMGLYDFIKNIMADAISLPGEQGGKSAKKSGKSEEIEIENLCQGVMLTLETVQSKLKRELTLDMPIENVAEFALQQGGAFIENLIAERFGQIVLTA